MQKRLKPSKIDKIDENLNFNEISTENSQNLKTNEIIVSRNTIEGKIVSKVKEHLAI